MDFANILVFGHDNGLIKVEKPVAPCCEARWVGYRVGVIVIFGSIGISFVPNGRPWLLNLHMFRGLRSRKISQAKRLALCWTKTELSYIWRCWQETLLLQI